MVMAGRPLDGLVTLATYDQNSNCNERDFSTEALLAPPLTEALWPLLQRVRLAPFVTRGFIVVLLEDDGGHERPLLPSPTELAMVDFSLGYDGLSVYPLCDALMKRMEQGVPGKMLDLRMCISDRYSEDWPRSFSEIVVNVLGPEKNFETRKRMKSMRKIVAPASFIEDNHSDTGIDDEDEEHWMTTQR